MKRLLLAAVCVAMLSTVSVGVALGHIIEEGSYFLYIGDDTDPAVKVEEDVYDWTQTENLTGFTNAYLYAYTVTNFSPTLGNPGIWCWGFCENPSSWGANVLAWSGPSGWFPGEQLRAGDFQQNGFWWTVDPWDCGCHPGGTPPGTPHVEAGWTGTMPPNPGAGANVLQDWIPMAQSQNTYYLVATNPPKKMVMAFAHDGWPVGGCASSENVYAFGKISAPTPEPVTMALLALGLPLGALAVRRRKED